MYPDNTIYKLAKSSKDYSKCHKLIEKSEFRNGLRLSFPTIFAERDGEVVGLLSTRPFRDSLMAGPLVAPSPFVAIRLSEAYEIILKMAKVERYAFTVDRKKKKWVNILYRALGMEPYKITDKSYWYMRELYTGKEE